MNSTYCIAYVRIRILHTHYLTDSLVCSSVMSEESRLTSEKRDISVKFSPALFLFLGRSRFDPRQNKGFFVNICVQNSSEAHPAPVQWVPGVLSPGVKCGRGVALTIHPHLVLRSRRSRSYTSSPCVTTACSVTTLTLFISRHMTNSEFAAAVVCVPMLKRQSSV
jgi:hypothetical protein